MQSLTHHFTFVYLGNHRLIAYSIWTPINRWLCALKDKATDHFHCNSGAPIVLSHNTLMELPFNRWVLSILCHLNKCLGCPMEYHFTLMREALLSFVMYRPRWNRNKNNSDIKQWEHILECSWRLEYCNILVFYWWTKSDTSTKRFGKNICFCKDLAHL